MDGTPGAIRRLKPIADAVGRDIEVVMDGRICRGSDVVKAPCLGARGVDRPRLLVGPGRHGQEGVQNVLDILRGGIESALLALQVPSNHDLTAAQLSFRRGERSPRACLSRLWKTS